MLSTKKGIAKVTGFLAGSSSSCTTRPLAASVYDSSVSYRRFISVVYDRAMPRPTAARRPNAGTKGVPRAEREAQIVTAATEVFGAQGFAATSVADVAARAGISKPLIYQYFGSKEG